jgi:hypothetical protein
MTDTINKALLSYYTLLDVNTITEDEYKLWIESLQEPMKKYFSSKSLQLNKGVLNLQRFILELRDIPLEEFMRDVLTEEEYRMYQKQTDKSIIK